MSYTYEVKKGRANRVAYRILGSVFVVVSVLQLITLIKGYAKHPMLTAFFLTALFLYGTYLIRNSLKRTAFDIIYRFDDNGMKVTHHYGEKQYSFDDIEFITMVIADEFQIFYVLNIKARKTVYTIPFTMKKDYCEKIYEFVNSRIKKDEE